VPAVKGRRDAAAVLIVNVQNRVVADVGVTVIADGERRGIQCPLQR
jgi:hypothetical protein